MREIILNVIAEILCSLAWILRIAAGVLLALFLFGVMVTLGAKAHSFYPYECCHDKDCWPTGEDAREPDPTFTPSGWLLASGELVPFNQARPSPDGRFHVCRRGGELDGALIKPSGTAPCLWVPQGGV